MTAHRMKLLVVTPSSIVVDETVDQVTAEAVDGSFAILPRHVGFVAPLVSGILEYRIGESTHVLAVQGGLLVKRGNEVSVATPRAVPGDNVLALQHALRVESDMAAWHESMTRSALARLETDAIRRLIEVTGDV